MILKFKLFESEMADSEWDMVVCTKNVEGLQTKNHIGYMREYGIEFINRFSDRLHDLNGTIKNKNGWFVDDKYMIPFEDNKIKNNIPLVFSEKFRNFCLSSLNFLLDYEENYFCDLSFIDLADKTDTVSCLSAANYKKLVNKNEVWTTPLRQNVKVGRFIRKIIPTENEQTIEGYVNEFKFSYNLNKKTIGIKFLKVAGNDIRKWYLEKSYAPGGGSLNKSCMKHEKSQKRLPLYTESTDKVRLLVILNEKDQLIGRALLWKLDSPEGSFYMDRVYVTEDYVEKYFYDYAKKMNFLTREFVEKNKIKLVVKLKKDFGPPSMNPFMDTFKFFIKNGNYLTNVFDNYKIGQYYEYINHD